MSTTRQILSRQRRPRGAQPRRSALLLVIVLAAPLFVGCTRQLSEAPYLYRQDGSDPWAGAPVQWLGAQVDVLFATDRQMEFVDGEPRYGHGRSPSLVFGSALVRMGDPDTELSWEQVRRASTHGKREQSMRLSVASTREIGRFPATGQPPELVDGQPVEPPAAVQQQRAAVAALHAELSRRLELAPRREAVVFVHGYNTRFEGAVFRCAELWHYLGREFVPVAYTWPAGSGIGPLRGYTHDRESGEFTSFHLRQLLLALAECPGLERIHIVAHSRGCDVATTALRELKLALGNDAKIAGRRLKLGQVVLAAPDLDWEVTQQRISADRITFMPSRFTVYVSPTDKAIAISDWLFGSVRRIGQLGQQDLSAIQQRALRSLGTLNIVRVTRNTDGVGHNYFVSDPAVLSDLILLLREDRPPGVEHGRPVKAVDGGFWELDKHYLKPR